MDHEQEEKLKNLQVSLQFKEASLNSLREVLATNLFHLPLSSASFICLSDYRLLSHTLKNFANHNLAAFMHTCVHACGDQRLCLGVSRTNVQSAM